MKPQKLLSVQVFPMAAGLKLNRLSSMRKFCAFQRQSEKYGALPISAAFPQVLSFATEGFTIVQ